MTDPSDGKKQLLEWDSPKHIEYLKNFSWESLQLPDDPFTNNGLCEISVLKNVVIEIQRSTKNHFPQPAEQFPQPIVLTCGHFSSSVTVYCYLIEALCIYGKTEQAVHLAMNLALAIVRYYSSWLEVNVRV